MNVTVRQDAKIRFDQTGCVFGMGAEAFVALQNFTLDIYEGEFVTVVGPSGCGKSTTLNIVAGLFRASSGRCLVDGEDITAPGPERGMIFQQYALFPWLSVRKNVEFGLQIKGTSRKQRRQIADHYINLVGLSDFADALPKMLSGGMKQRCAIARAYAVAPKVLLMDEPFGALDALTRVRMQKQLLDTWLKEQRTIMFVTHDVDEAVYLANRVIVMAARPGRLQQIIEVDLPYPRDDQMRLSTKFATLRNKVWQAVYTQPDNFS